MILLKNHLLSTCQNWKSSLRMMTLWTKGLESTFETPDLPQIKQKYDNEALTARELAAVIPFEMNEHEGEKDLIDFFF